MAFEYFPDNQPDMHLENRKKHDRLGNIMLTINSAEAVIKVERFDFEGNDADPNVRHGWKIYFA
jgi:hypothetical protein